MAMTLDRKLKNITEPIKYILNLICILLYFLL